MLLTEDPGSVSRTRIRWFPAPSNSSSRGSKVLFWSECAGQIGPNTSRLLQIQMVQREGWGFLAGCLLSWEVVLSRVLLGGQHGRLENSPGNCLSFGENQAFIFYIHTHFLSSCPRVCAYQAIRPFTFRSVLGFQATRRCSLFSHHGGGHLGPKPRALPSSGLGQTCAPWNTKPAYSS